MSVMVGNATTDSVGFEQTSVVLRRPGGGHTPGSVAVAVSTGHSGTAVKGQSA